MSENRTIRLVEIPIGAKDGFIWNRLHGEREDVCEALLKDSGPFLEEHREVLQKRLRKIDDALDRLMSGSYGSCSNCGHVIDDTNLDIDPALALCLDCWSHESGIVGLRDEERGTSDIDDVVLESRAVWLTTTPSEPIGGRNAIQVESKMS